MKRRVANCPACGGPVEFRLSTALVTVCDFCHSVVARTDTRLEDHGKVAELVETNSPFKRGLIGQFEKKSFEIVGRVQYRHPAGGVWDEWYLKFPGDRVKWLAQAQGKFYLTEEKRLNEESPLPDYGSLTPGQLIQLPDRKTLTIAEFGIATAQSADGDIPWDYRPNTEHRFADLSGPGLEFATIEYESSGPRFFLGREVSIAELGLPSDRGEIGVAPSSNTTALQVNCPRCAGPLVLHAPDQTLRVCCPHCKSLLDCQNGALQYLQTLTVTAKEKPLIPLGATGRLADIEFTVIGFMVRSVVCDGIQYPWTEYLLYNSTAGFRWLVRSSGHWSFVESVPVASVKESPGRAVFDGKDFRLFEKGTAIVNYVIGEFYWRVSVGEQVCTFDYINPPFMLSSETTITNKGSELNYSIGTYVEKEDLETAFGLGELPAPWGVGAIQPTPTRGYETTIWLSFAAALVFLDVLFSSGITKKPVDQFHFVTALLLISIWPAITGFLRWQFEVSRWRDSDFSPYRNINSESTEGDSDE